MGNGSPRQRMRTNTGRRVRRDDLLEMNLRFKVGDRVEMRRDLFDDDDQTYTDGKVVDRSRGKYAVHWSDPWDEGGYVRWHRPEDLVIRENAMKITAEKLRRLVREELSSRQVSNAGSALFRAIEAVRHAVNEFNVLALDDRGRLTEPGARGFMQLKEMEAELLELYELYKDQLKM